MAVLLVLASGTAVSLAVTDTGSSDAGTNAAVQETTTGVVETTEDVGVEETTEDAGVETTEAVGEETTAAAGDGDDAATAQQSSVTINEQESDGEQVVVDSVTMEEGGFVAIHDQTLLDDNDAVGSVVGTSVYLEAGTHENVTITLGQTIDETQTLVAMPHQDTNDNQVYDFVISAGEVDGPYTADGETVVDQATVTVDGAAEETATEDVEETTEVLTEEPAETTEVLTEEPAETTEAAEETDVVETEEPAETTEEPEETTEVLTEEPEETTEAVEETTEVVEETTPAETEVEEPAGDQQQFVFKVEQMNIDRWSFVVGDEETPDRTETVSDISVSDRRVEINLTEMLQQQAEAEDQFTTQDPEQAQEQLEENLSGDLETVRFVIENVNVENATLVVTAPADMDLPEQPGMGPQLTTEEDEAAETTQDVVVETTEEDVETTEEDVVVETTEEDVVETTEEDVAVETTEEDVETTEEDVVETTEEDVAETTEADAVETTEEDVVDTTEADAVETTTEQPQLDSFNVSSIDAPDSASAGDTVTVSAEVSNPNEVEATQQVELRLDGDVVERQSVTVAGSDAQTVTFELDTSNLSSGDYSHGVFTRDFGEVAVLTVDDPAAEGDETEVVEETTEVVGTETPEVEATTEADGIETTVAANETTVES